MLKPLLLFFISFFIIICSINEINSLSLYDFEISTNDKNEVGKRGSVIFSFYNELFSDDMSRKIIFKKNIFDDKNKNYEILCGPC